MDGARRRLHRRRHGRRCPFDAARVDACPGAADTCRAACPDASHTCRAQPTAAGYVGSETCKGCHEDQWNKFAPTKMGRLMLQLPRSAKEGVGCEGCHGPGQKHAEAGGGKGVGGMITFAKNDKTPVETRNAVCTTCHNKGPHLFW